jgi:hypothetical protein
VSDNVFSINGNEFTNYSTEIKTDLIKTSQDSHLFQFRSLPHHGYVLFERDLESGGWIFAVSYFDIEMKSIQPAPMGLFEDIEFAIKAFYNFVNTI